MPDELQGVPVTPDILRQQYYSDGIGVIDQAIYRLSEGVPPVFAFRVLWALEADNKRMLGRLEELLLQLGSLLTSLTEKTQMQTVFDQFVIEVGKLVNPVVQKEPPPPAIMNVPGLVGNAIPTPAGYEEPPKVPGAPAALPTDEFDVMNHQELVDWVIKSAYLGNEALRTWVNTLDDDTLRATARQQQP